MQPIIGILLRDENNKLYVKKEMFEAVTASGGLPIGFNLQNTDEILALCNGFIIPGGDDYTKSELEFLSKLYEQNKKVLGICLGMQAMGVFLGGNLIRIDNHKSNNLYVHDVSIKKNSLLYKIIGKEKISVNSRHEFGLENTKARIVGVSDNGHIEAIEDNDKTFFLGIQWHPESLYLFNQNAQKIFDYFIKICGGDSY